MGTSNIECPDFSNFAVISASMSNPTLRRVMLLITLVRKTLYAVSMSVRFPLYRRLLSPVRNLFATLRNSGMFVMGRRANLDP